MRTGTSAPAHFERDERRHLQTGQYERALRRRARLKEFRSENYVPQAIPRPNPLILVRAILGSG